MSKHPDLTAYLLGELKGAEVEAHIASCAQCQAELVGLRAVVSSLQGPPLATASDEVWTRVTANRERKRFRGWWLALPAAAIVAFFVWRAVPGGEALVVETVSGDPRVEGGLFGAGGKLGTGQTLVTDASASARVTLPTVGSVELMPGSRLRLLKSNSKQRQFALDFGRLKATVSAPPRLFVVDTPSASAVDLGCAYELTVDGKGGSVLRVTQGWVVLESKFGASYVRAGMACGSGPGGQLQVPVREDAQAQFKEGLGRYARGESAALPMILAWSKAKDGLTLWHLIPRAPAGDRVLIYERLAALFPPPVKVRRAGILSLDPEMLKTWREDFAPINDADFWR